VCLPSPRAHALGYGPTAPFGGSEPGSVSISSTQSIPSTLQLPKRAAPAPWQARARQPMLARPPPDSRNRRKALWQMGLRAFWRVIHILPTRSGPRSQGVRKATEATGSYRSYRRQPSTPSRHPGGPPEPPRSTKFGLNCFHYNTYGVIHNLACLRARDLTPCFYPTPCYTLHPRGPQTAPQGWEQRPLDQAHSRHSPARHSSIPPTFHSSIPRIRISICHRHGDGRCHAHPAALAAAIAPRTAYRDRK